MLDKIDPDEFAAVDPSGRTQRYARQLLLVASSGEAWQRLLSLWHTYLTGEPLPTGFAAFRDVFSRLRTLRPWDDHDRLERTGAIDVWEREVASLGEELVEFEVELWLRADPDRRRIVSDGLRADLEAAGGEFVSEFVSDDIDYHGVLGRVPASRLLDAVARHEVVWLRTESVRLFRAVGQMAVPEPADAGADPAVALTSRPLPSGDARLALFDGFPLARHEHLRDRILIDDPEGWETTIGATRRVHGTAMASVILHGDLNDSSSTLAWPLYVRPILRATAPDWVRAPAEELPRDRLQVDFLHSVIVRLFEGAAVAPVVTVVVLAVGDAAMQFDRLVSPLARLVDWLSSRYNVLFLVSAGNQIQAISVPDDIDPTDTYELQSELLRALDAVAAFQRLLSPAESVNALTIGAAHADSAAPVLGDDRLDPFVTSDLPNIGSAYGSGVRRAIKPDVLLRGGRQFVRLEPPASGSRLVTVPPSRRSPGVRVASPSTTAGLLDATSHDTGTSMATAMAGHHAGRLLEDLQQLRGVHGDSMPAAEYDAVLVKAALAHTAAWGTAKDALDALRLEREEARSREAVARVVGYGRAQPARALDCDEYRVTLLGAGRITRDAAHTFRFPLPPSLSGSDTYRRVTLTLAWLTPTNPQHRNYRRAALRLDPRGPENIFGDTTDADQNGSRRGTLQHEVREGSRAVEFVSNSAVELVVSCRADAGALESSVPYALLVTVEVAPRSASRSTKKFNRRSRCRSRSDLLARSRGRSFTALDGTGRPWLLRLCAIPFARA